MLRITHCCGGVFFKTRPIVLSLDRSTARQSRARRPRVREAASSCGRILSAAGSTPARSAWLPSRRQKSTPLLVSPLLAAQDRREALFDQLPAHPVDHRWAGIRRLDDDAVAPSLAAFRDIGFEQNRRLQQPLRRTSSWARSSPFKRTTYFFTELGCRAIVPLRCQIPRQSELANRFNLVEAGNVLSGRPI
jgi:hypothetical protein